MDIGTSIFLSACIFGLVYLYNSTRDRWRWKKIAVYFGVGTLALIALSFSPILWEQKNSKFDISTAALDSYQELTISDTKNDIKLKKGAPTETTERLWGYTDEDKQWETIIIFKEDKIQGIFYVGQCRNCHTLYGLNIGDTYDTVIATLGQPTTKSTTEDHLTQTLSFEKKRASLRLAKGKIVAMGIYNPTTGPPSFTK